MKQLPVRLLRGPLGLLIFLGLQGPSFSFAQSTSVPAAQSTPSPGKELVSISPAERRRYEGEARQVSIVRDRWGIPHIYGKTDAAAVFRLMYVESQNDFSPEGENYLQLLCIPAEG